MEETTNLSEEQVREALRTFDMAIINEISDLSFKLYHREHERTKDLDTKASSNFSLIGVSFSLVFVISGLLIEKISNTKVFVGDYYLVPSKALIVFYLITSSLFLLQRCLQSLV